MKKLSNQEIKGSADWLPDEYAKRKYIFDTWRKVCLKYGFEEYLTPLFEQADVYRAKSGEDVGGKELLIFKDLGNRELAVRPEMTPSVARLVSKIYRTTPKPIKFFSIANFFRNEKPQRGRNREFWQLNCDIFGTDNILSDIEMIEMAIDIMLEFGSPKESFVLKLSDRRLLEAFFNALNVKEEKKTQTMRLLDKKDKLKKPDFDKALLDLGFKQDDIKKINSFIGGDKEKGFLDIVESSEELKDVYKQLKEVIKKIENDGYKDYIVFDPSIIRGFDYYNGLVFEVFDLHKENRRTIFGGGRYNGLGSIFGEENFSALGFAPGDETTKLFLESWNLFDKMANDKDNLYYLPIIDENLIKETRNLAKKMRANSKNILLGYEEQKISKAFKFAENKKINKVVIFGNEEKQKGEYKVKDLIGGKEESYKI
ncbi:MAG: histidine--tRNA ligase [Patescibacteria group bacterium]|jgi:histidyl-tRNA synthetase|nr:histidine--tRNA ligase [Patescibacteria group bacterium]